MNYVNFPQDFTELEVKEKPALKLRLEFKNGNRYFFPYAYMLRVEYDVSGTLTLFTSEHKIIIKGRGLDLLEEQLYNNQLQGFSKRIVEGGNFFGLIRHEGFLLSLLPSRKFVYGSQYLLTYLLI